MEDKMVDGERKEKEEEEEARRGRNWVDGERRKDRAEGRGQGRDPSSGTLPHPCPATGGASLNARPERDGIQSPREEEGP